MSGRPLDVLEASLNEPVTVHLKDGTTYYGSLAGYDQHMNVVLEEDVDGAADSDDESGADEADLSDSSVTTVQDTTIIRGDNVVTIKA